VWGADERRIDRIHTEYRGDKGEREGHEGHDRKALSDIILLHGKERRIRLAELGSDFAVGRDDRRRVIVLRFDVRGVLHEAFAEEGRDGKLT